MLTNRDGHSLRRVVLGGALVIAVLLPAGVASAVEGRTETEIRARWQELKPRYVGTPHAVSPSLESPFSAGSLQQGFLEDGLNSINYARFLAGLPDDVVLDSTYTSRAQHGAVLLAVGQFAHSQPKPTGMDDAFYATAVGATSSSNIGYGYSSLWSFNRGCLDDDDTGNIDRVGHRRWLLNPGMAKTGMGYASSRSDTYVFDDSRQTAFAYDTIKWPSAGAFPAEMFGSSVPWSVTLNPQIYSWTQGTAGHTVVLRRTRDNKTWTFTSNDTNKNGEYFAFETSGYGISNCFIFRPDPATVGGYQVGDVFEVTLSGGITTRAGGAPAVVSYSTTFVSDRTAPQLSLVAPATTSFGSAEVYGHLRDAGGRGIADKAVQIQRYSGGWQPVVTVTTDSNGKFSKTLGPKTKTTYRAYFAGADSLPEMASPARAVLPKARLTRATNFSKLTRSKTYYMKGYTQPRHVTSDANKIRIRAYKKGSDGTYRYVKSFTATYSYYSSSKTRYRAAVKLASKGLWRLRSYHAADSKNAKSFGSYDYVRVK